MKRGRSALDRLYKEGLLESVFIKKTVFESQGMFQGILSINIS